MFKSLIVALFVLGTNAFKVPLVLKTDAPAVDMEHGEDHNPDFDSMSTGKGTHRPRVLATPQLGMTNY